MPNLLANMDNYLGGTLGTAHHNYVMSYNHSIGGFEMVHSDSVLIKQTETPLPTGFSTVIADEIDLANLGLEEVDGGGFN